MKADVHLGRLAFFLQKRARSPTGATGPLPARVLGGSDVTAFSQALDSSASSCSTPPASRVGSSPTCRRRFSVAQLLPAAVVVGVRSINC